MHRFFSLKPAWALCVYIILDTLCVAMGMGVPIFCIFFGIPVGWYIIRNITARTMENRRVHRKILLYATVTSAYTFIMMAILWGRCIPMLFDPAADFENFGIPMILYEPRASFIGWLVLMIFISPFLQLLATVFGAYIVVVRTNINQGDLL
jgi:hypothetical protein